MRLIKLAFLSFIILFLIVTAMSLMIPGHVRISRAVNLKTEEDSVRLWVRDTGQWPRWHPAFQGANASNRLAEKRTTITPVVENDSLVQLRWQLMMNPKPMNTSRAIKLSTIISKKVSHPCSSVNWKA